MIVARTCAIYHYRSWITDWHSHPTRWFYFTVKVVQFFRAVGSNGASYTAAKSTFLLDIWISITFVRIITSDTYSQSCQNTVRKKEIQFLQSWITQCHGQKVFRKNAGNHAAHKPAAFIIASGVWFDVYVE